MKAAIVVVLVIVLASAVFTTAAPSNSIWKDIKTCMKNECNKNEIGVVPATPDMNWITQRPCASACTTKVMKEMSY